MCSSPALPQVRFCGCPEFDSLAALHEMINSQLICLLPVGIFYTLTLSEFNWKCSFHCLFILALKNPIILGSYLWRFSFTFCFQVEMVTKSVGMVYSGMGPDYRFVCGFYFYIWCFAFLLLVLLIFFRWSELIFSSLHKKWNRKGWMFNNLIYSVLVFGWSGHEELISKLLWIRKTIQSTVWLVGKKRQS